MSRKVSSGEDGDSQKFMGDKTGDTHHGGPAVVEFDSSGDGQVNKMGRQSKSTMVWYHHNVVGLSSRAKPLPLAKLGLLIKLVPTKVQGTVAVVAREFGFVVQPAGVSVHNLGHKEKGSHLAEDIHTILGFVQGGERLETIGNTFGSRKANAC